MCEHIIKTTVRNTVEPETKADVQQDIDFEQYQKDIENDIFKGTPVRKLDNDKGFIIDLNPDASTEFETVNKLKDGAKSHKDDDVATMQNLVFEIDNESLEVQKERLKGLIEEGVPNRATLSGGKSLHIRLTVKDSPKNKSKYKFLWNLLNKKFFDGKADPSLSHPAAKTRRPLAWRKDKEKWQHALFLNDTVLDFPWREDYELHLKEKEAEAKLEKARNAFYYKERNETSDLETLLTRNICTEAKNLIRNTIPEGEGHRQLPSAIASLKACGVSFDVIDNLVKNTGVMDSNKTKPYPTQKFYDIFT